MTHSEVGLFLFVFVRKPQFSVQFSFCLTHFSATYGSLSITDYSIIVLTSIKMTLDDTCDNEAN